MHGCSINSAEGVNHYARYLNEKSAERIKVSKSKSCRAVRFCTFYNVMHATQNAEPVIHSQLVLDF